MASPLFPAPGSNAPLGHLTSALQDQVYFSELDTVLLNPVPFLSNRGGGRIPLGVRRKVGGGWNLESENLMHSFLPIHISGPQPPLGQLTRSLLRTEALARV